MASLSLFAVAMVTCMLGTVLGNELVVADDGSWLCPLVSDQFSYDFHNDKGPSHWHEFSPCCAGARQSPRNLVTHGKLSSCGQDFPAFGYNTTHPLQGSLYNNGHDPVFSPKASSVAALVGAPYIDSPYVLENIHIHFYRLRRQGSEHAVNNRFYNGEVHLVHYKEEYGSAAQGVLHSDGLLVIGLFLEISNQETNSEVATLIDNLQALAGVGKEYAVDIEIDLQKLLPASQEFFTYAGSLTTPPCSESVRWVIMREPLDIEAEELAILTSMTDDEGHDISKDSNDRPLQESSTIVETNFRCHGTSGEGK